MGPPHDELFDRVSPLLEEPVIASDDGVRRQGTGDDISLLLDANARLLALAVQLSNLVGDLPPLPEVKHSLRRR